MEAVTINDLIRLAVVIGGLWGFIKIVREIISAVNERHDKEQKWDKYEEQLKKDRAEIDEKLDQTTAELYILTECMSAVLDGLKQLNCNGPVTEAKQSLDAYLIKRAHT